MRHSNSRLTAKWKRVFGDYTMHCMFFTWCLVKYYFPVRAEPLRKHIVLDALYDFSHKFFIWLQVSYQGDKGSRGHKFNCILLYKLKQK